jgi:hypothetical protein
MHALVFVWDVQIDGARKHVRLLLVFVNNGDVFGRELPVNQPPITVHGVAHAIHTQHGH